MNMKRSDDTSALREHPTFDLEEAMGAAWVAATDAFLVAGMPAPKVLINVAWGESGCEFVAGGSVPPGTPAFISESLRATADEVEESAAGVVSEGDPNAS
jgi:hypothetical protein